MDYESTRFEKYGSSRYEMPCETFHELYDQSASPTKPPMTVKRQRRSSPELVHPVNSNSDRGSLWHRRRGGDRRRSDAEQSRNDWSIIDDTEKARSDSSRRPFKPNTSFQIVLDDEDEVLPSNDSENLISPDESNHPDRSWTSSPNSGLASPPSHMLSPTSPLGNDMYPLTTIVSPNTEARNGSNSGMHEEAADGSICLGASQLVSASIELNHTLSPCTPHGTYPIHPDRFDKPSESETSSLTAKATVPQVDASRSRITGVLPSDFSLVSPLRNPHVELISQFKDDISPLPKPATAFHASSLYDHFNCQTSIVTGPTLPEMDMGDTNVEHGWEAAPRTSYSFNSINAGIGRVESIWDVETREGLLKKDEEDVKFSQLDQKMPDLGQPNTGQSLSFRDIQLKSPFDNFIAALTPEHITTNPKPFSDDERRHPSAVHYSRDLMTSQAFAIKMLPLCFDCNSFPVSGSTPKHIQVQELQELVHIVNTEWMQRMKSQPDLWSRCKTLVESGLFERGIRTLKEFICGKLPQTFEAVFALLHLAFAAARLAHWQHDYYSWHVLYDDAVQWQHTLSTDEDRSSIVAAMSCWGLSELEPKHTSLRSNSLRRSLDSSDWKIYHDTLRNNEVFRACICFLDGKSIHPQFVAYGDHSN